MATVTPSPHIPTLIKKMGLSIIIVVLLFSSFTIVPAGHRGVVFNLMAGVEVQSLSEGFNFKIPFIEQVYDMEVRNQKLEISAASASKDLQIVQSTIAVNYNLHPDTVGTLFQEVGLSYEERIIQPAIQETVKAVSARYTAEELITKRQLVRDEMKEELRKRLEITNIYVIDFNIVNFDFSEEFNNAIEEKVTAEQRALKAERDLERIKIEKEQKITQAEAEAEALRLQRLQVTPELIKLREVENQRLAIEKWNGQMPYTLAGGNTIAMLPLQPVSSPE